MGKNKVERAFLVLVLLLFGTIFALISLPNHYFFRTAALDLGMFNHALYHFAHFKQNYFTLDISGAEINYFGDHFAPFTILLAPFYYLFGSYTLLIIQVLFILFGGYGIYLYTKRHTTHTYLPLIVMIQFFGIWGIYSALSFDFHTNVVAAMLVPWFILFYERKDIKWILLVFVLILSCKENMALWMFFILLGLIFTKNDKSLKTLLKLEIPLMGFSIFYFIVIVGVVMPFISQGEGTNQLGRYEHLGDSVGSIIYYIIMHPLEVANMMFANTTSDQLLDGIKMETHWMVLLSGGILLLFKPAYLLMLLPIYAQKMLSLNHSMWGINEQYSIEFAPIISICLVQVTKDMRQTIQVIAIILFAALTHFATYDKLDNRKSIWYNKTNSRFYQKRHYQTTIDRTLLFQKLNEIPADAVISVHAKLAPHLAFRDKIYSFPVVKDATFIVLLKPEHGTYPLTENEYHAMIKKLNNDKKFDKTVETDDLLIFKRSENEHFKK